MIKIILILGLISFSAFGTIPETAEGWYLPPEGWNPTETEASWEKNGKAYGCKIDEQGLFSIYPPGVSEAEKQALQAAVTAWHETKWNQKRIEVIGENLHKVFATDGITITGETPDGSIQSYTIKFSSGIGESETIQGETDHMKWNLADQKSLQLLQGNKIQISGWDLPNSETSLWDIKSGAVMVRYQPNGAGVHYLPYYGVDNLSLAPGSSSKKLQLKEWDTAPANGLLPLSEALVKGKKGIYSDYKLVVRNSSKGMNYVDIGTLSIGGGAPVDGTSITTNEIAGAIVQGEASLYGWSTADDMGLPYKSDGKLAWKAADKLVDGSSLAFADVDGEKRFEVKDAHVYAGNHSRHYFGTSNDKTATLGWHELPNITTNRVEGDEATIASTVDEQDPGLKRLGLRGWNKSWGGDPLFVVNAGGSIGYIPLPAITNLAACACSNKWENTAKWIGGAEIAEDGGLTLPEESLDKYLYDRLGYIYSTTPANFHFDNDGDYLTASFNAPTNWVDGKSIGMAGNNAAYEIKGWVNASACSATMSAMLSQPTGSDATTHLLLAKKTNTGELHYVPIGDGVQSGAAVDDTTITTNTAHGAMTQGVASIYGWSNAANDTYLSKNEGGALEWRKVVSAIEAGSGITITSNGTAQVVAHNLVAGAGISITPADNGTSVTIASATPANGTVVDPHAQELTFLTELWYDHETHQIKAKRITAKVMFVGTVPDAEEFVAVQCTPHSAEHETESGSN